MDEDQAKSLLASLLMVPQIRYREDNILAAVAKRFPEIVLDWFGSRLARSKNMSGGTYQAIPDSLGQQMKELRETLTPHPQKVLTAVRNWYNDPETKETRGTSHFLSLIYPAFDEILSDHLATVVAQRDADTLQFLVEVLEGFNDSNKLLPLLRQILRSPAAPNNIEERMKYCIVGIVVASGEFGLGQAYLRKAEMLEPWLEDENVRVRRFAENLIAEFKNLAAWHNRQSEQDIAARRLSYGEDPI